MDRIENVDLRESLKEIARNNTFYHLDNDINISFGQMERAAKLDDPTETTLVWVSYPGGIDCYSEREVFQKDTRAHNGVMFHGFDMQSDRKLAYAVDVAALIDGKLYGTLYQIDINEYAAHVKQNAVVSDTMRLYLAESRDGFEQIVMSKADFNRDYPNELPKMTYYRPEPRDPAALDTLLFSAHKERMASTQPCSQYSHTSKLYDERREFYTNEIMRVINMQPNANTPDKQNFAVPLNSYIADNFGPEQFSQLMELMPYKTVTFTIQKGQNRMCVVVPRDEVLLLRLEQEQNSLLARLEKAAIHIIETSARETQSGNYITDPGDVPADILSSDEYKENIHAIAEIMRNNEAVADVEVGDDGSIDAILYMDYCPNLELTHDESDDSPDGKEIVDAPAPKPNTHKPSILGQLADAKKEADASQTKQAPQKNKETEL